MGTTVVDGIIRSVADAMGVEPTDLDVAIQNWIDTDAVRQRVDHPSDA